MSSTDEHRCNLIAQRYGHNAPPMNVIWNEMVEAQLSHKSVRNFLTDPLPDGALETMIAAAQSASTAGAAQQWSVVAVSDTALKQRLSDTIAPTVPTDRIPFIEDAPVLLLWVADLSRSVAIATAKGGDPVAANYLDSFLMASMDVSLAAQNAALAAESIGLGIVYLGVMRNAAKEVADMIGLPSHSFVTFGMAVGHPDPTVETSLRPRLPQPVVLHHNVYDPSGYLGYLEGYEATYREFRETGGLRNRAWQDTVQEGTCSMEYMGGRENLRQMVTEKGFGLG